MATSVYDNPAELRIIDTYAPINFDLLYRAAKTQTDAIDRSINELSTNVQNWAKFRSPSAADTLAYYDRTMRYMDGYISQLASNPDLLKSAQGRYGLTSRINSIDFAALSQLESSSQALLQRQLNIAQMQAKGLYNPNWDNVDIQNYNTLQQGILTDLTPIAYQNVYDLTSQIAKTPDQYIGHIDPYSYEVGVTEDMLRNSIRTGLGSIAANPAAQMTMRDILQEYAARGIALTPELIENEFVERAVQANYNNLVRRNIQFDQVGLTRLKGSIDMAMQGLRNAGRKGSGKEEEEYTFSSPSEQLKTDIRGISNLKMSRHDIFSSLIAAEQDIDTQELAVMSRLSQEMDPLIVAKQAADRDGNAELSTQLAGQINNVRERYLNTVNTSDQLRSDASKIVYGNAVRAGMGLNIDTPLDKNVFENEDFVKTSSDLISLISANPPVENLNERLSSSYNSNTAWDNLGALKQAYQPTSSKYVKLNQDIVYDQVGADRNDIAYKEFIDKWNNGSLRNIQTIPTGEAYSYIDRYGQEKYYASSDVYIPYDDMKKFLDTSFQRTTNGKAKEVFNADLIEVTDKDGKNAKKYYKFKAQTELPTGGLSDQNYDRNISKQKGGTVESRNFRMGQTVAAFGEDL